MTIIVDNLDLPLRVAQTVFCVLGFWAPTTLKGLKRIMFHVYTIISYVFLSGIYIIIQAGDLCQVWGDVELMTGAVFLLFTNLSLSAKLLNVYCRKENLKAMINEGNSELSAECRPEGLSIIHSNNRETKIQLYIYLALAYTTIFGWSISAEKNQLPMRAWYPYDTSKSPAYELTYAHQCIALLIAASLNVCLDTLVTSLISQCRCRFNLLSLSLRTLCSGLVFNQGLLSPEAEVLLTQRVRRCVEQHQAILNHAAQLQDFFSITIFGQFGVSMGIICVTAYQLAMVFESALWFFAMLAYMAVMLMEVFIYCYHGNMLMLESGEVAGAVYDCPWYICSPAQRRRLLLIMMRAQREVRIKAGNLMELSLATFMSIVKASYTFFTVLQRVEDGGSESI